MAKSELLQKIEDLLTMGTSIEFTRELNMFGITLRKTGRVVKTEKVVLPFNHLNDQRVMDYIKLMEEKGIIVDEPQCMAENCSNVATCGGYCGAHCQCKA